MVFEPHEEFKEYDLELGEGVMHSFTFTHQNDTVFQVTNTGIAFVQSDYFIRAITTRIIINDSKYHDGTDMISLDGQVIFSELRRAIIVMKEAEFVPNETNERIKLSSSTVKDNILKFMKNQKAVGYISNNSGNKKDTSTATRNFFVDYADSYMKGMYTQENDLFKYDGNENNLGHSKEKVSLWGSKNGFGVICLGLGLNLFFDASLKNCYAKEHESGLSERTWTNARQIGKYQDDGEHHVTLSIYNESVMLSFTKTKNGKVVRVYRMMMDNTPVTFIQDGSERRTVTTNIKTAIDLIGQFGYHGYKSGEIYTGEPF